MTAGNDAIRVLIVDDDRGVREAVERMTSGENFTVKSVGSGSEAVTSLATSYFDVILLDLWMPGLTGLDTLEAIRHRDRNVSVVAMSAMGTAATKETCLQSGAIGYIQKPFKRAELFQSLRSAGSASRNAREQAATFGDGPGSILLADDHDPFRQALAQRLRLDGFFVDEVPDGDEALIAWRQRPYDMYLFDVHMPQRSGAAAAAAILADEPEASVILMTGESARSEWNETVRVCLRKPIDFKKLTATILFLMETARRGRERVHLWRQHDEMGLWARSASHLRQKMRKFRQSPAAKAQLAAIFVAQLAALVVLSAVDAIERTAMQEKLADRQSTQEKESEQSHHLSEMEAQAIKHLILNR